MGKGSYLLDTSAILAFLEDEAGADRVETILRQGQAILPFPVLLETYYITLQNQPLAEADRRYAMLKELPVTLIWEVDEPTMLTAGRFKATYRLSLADALIAAFAARQAAILVHKDPEYEALAGIVQQENLLHKTDVHGEGLQEACGKKPGTK